MSTGGFKADSEEPNRRTISVLEWSDFTPEVVKSEDVARIVVDLREAVSGGRPNLIASAISRLKREITRDPCQAGLLVDLDVDIIIGNLLHNEDYIARFCDKLVGFARKLVSCEDFESSFMCTSSFCGLLLATGCRVARSNELVIEIIDLIGRIASSSELATLQFVTGGVHDRFMELYRDGTDRFKPAVLSSFGQVMRFLSGEMMDCMMCVWTLLAELIHGKDASPYPYELLYQAMSYDETRAFVTAFVRIDYRAMYELLGDRKIDDSCRVWVYRALWLMLRVKVPGAVLNFDWSCVVSDLRSANEDVVVMACQISRIALRDSRVDGHVDDRFLESNVIPVLDDLVESATFTVKSSCLSLLRSIMTRRSRSLCRVLLERTRYLSHLSTFLETSSEEEKLTRAIMKSLIFLTYLMDWDIVIEFFQREGIVERVVALASTCVCDKLQVLIEEFFRLEEVFGRPDVLSTLPE